MWAKDLWQQARELAFISKFVGTGPDAVIQRITELSKTEKGEMVVMHLLADLVKDGIQGDNEREGNEEAMEVYSETITFDMISHGVRQKGKLAKQKAAVSFREDARDRLAYWLSNRIDQLALLTLSGVSYAYNLDGSTRADPTFQELAFASEVSAPTANRHVRVTADASKVYTGLAAGNTAAVDATDILSYEALVDLNVYAKNQYVRPIRAGGKEYYIMLIRPEALAQLKKDANFQRAIVTGMDRGASNPYFSGGTVTVDGIVLHEHRYVYNTKGAASKWGGGAVEGSRALLLGGQALAFADLGAPEWSEKWFQYDSSPGINVDKMFGFVKPVFYAQQTGTNEDFGVIAVDHAI